MSGPRVRRRMSIVRGRLLLVCIVMGLAFAVEEVHAVRADFDRCVILVDRADREIRRYEQTVAQLSASLDPSSHLQRTAAGQELARLVRRSDFLRTRSARALSQTDRIRAGLREARGPICASCPLALSVGLYCRGAESLLSEVDEAFNRVREFESTLRTHQAGDALAVLRPLLPSSEELPLPDRGKAVWRFSSGVDYYHLEDVDTLAMTPEQRESLRQLTEVPLSVWTSVQWRKTRSAAVVEELVPTLHLSERRTRLSLPLRSRKVGEQLRFMATPKAEKWYDDAAGDDAAGDAGAGDAGAVDSGSGHAGAARFRRHDSDMVGVELTTHLTSRPDPQQQRVWQLPLDLDWEHYRRNRLGYESFVEFRITPSLALHNQARTRRGRIWAEARREQYYGSDADTLDVNRFSIRLEAEQRTTAGAVRLGAGWMTDRHLEVRNPQQVDRWEGSVLVQRQWSARWGSQWNTRYVYERNRLAAIDTPPATTGGRELSLVPVVTFRPREDLSLALEPRWERRWSQSRAAAGQTPAQQRYYLWEARSVWEVLARFACMRPTVDGTLYAGFRGKSMDAAAATSTADSRALRTGAEVSLSLFGPFTINAIGDYQYRTYAPYGPRARVTENMSFSTYFAAALR